MLLIRRLRNRNCGEEIPCYRRDLRNYKAKHKVWIIGAAVKKEKEIKVHVIDSGAGDIDIISQITPAH
jgi:hypothetical protein